MKLFRFESLVVGLLIFAIVIGINPLTIKLDAVETVVVLFAWMAVARFQLDRMRANRQRILIGRRHG